jgi:hypothetical protein
MTMQSCQPNDLPAEVGTAVVLVAHSYGGMVITAAGRGGVLSAVRGNLPAAAT